MSGYKNFAVVGAGNTGSFIVRQLLKDKSAGIVNQVVVLTRQVSLASLGQTLPTHWQWQESKTTVEGDAKVVVSRLGSESVSKPSRAYSSRAAKFNRLRTCTGSVWYPSRFERLKSQLSRFISIFGYTLKFQN
jgi:hypothetical protein